MSKALNFEAIHTSWLPCIEKALAEMDQAYLDSLETHSDWLPGPTQVFNAFQMPVTNVKTLLLGESPYPRAASANGYAFWDANVDGIWSDTGFTKPVNRATSLRNFIKMLLVTEGALSPEDTTQPAIAALNKQNYVTTLTELFQNMQNQGFLLLNASLVLSDRPVAKEAAYWQPLLKCVLHFLNEQEHDIELLLFGKIAQKIAPLLKELDFSSLISEHPYNVSFIHNQEVGRHFKPLSLLINMPKTLKS